MQKQVQVQTNSQSNADWELELENYLVRNRDTTVLIGTLALAQFCPKDQLSKAIVIAENFGFEVM